MKQIKITISDEFYRNLKIKADTIGITLSQLVKYAVIKESQSIGIKQLGDDMNKLSKEIEENIT